MMIDAIEDITMIPFKRALKKNDQKRKTDFSFSIDSKIKKLPEKKDLPAQQFELPFAEWKTPSQPHGYIKGRDNDLL
jgi:hypothetical protein